MKQFRFKARLVPTGNPIATLEQVMAQRVDVGWAVPPMGMTRSSRTISRSRAGKRRPGHSRQDRERPDYQRGYSGEAQKRDRPLYGRHRETVEWMYADPAALRRFTELAGVSENLAQRLRDQFFTKDMCHRIRS